ncbi:cytochrome P450 [Stereum hirsutum FP-91666 SS1]|uniref:cytochrome P450 n=1 Tax=Stereum hirsutum (strain FP-91666) TaxID=721885 RepID=UPI000444A592|nr:cytochrome P450 [Stereum hirsutum FP-91666 SS1]EIM80810.1 cytochrome P450 [Stereum hirsutum FP-91666 SS1]
MDLSSPVVLLLGGIVLSFAVWRILSIGRREKALPPGPATTHLLGNLHQFPTEYAYRQLTSWAKEYGGIYSLKMGPGNLMVVTDVQIMRDLIDNKSYSSADREPSYPISIVTDGKNSIFGPYTREWRKSRQQQHDMLSKEACERHLLIQTAEATQLLWDILHDPENFANHGFRYANSLITSVFCGIRSPHHSSLFSATFHKMIGEWARFLEPGHNPPVDLIPLLKYVPARWARWKRMAASLRRTQRTMYGTLIERCEAHILENDRKGAALEKIIDEREERGIDRALLRGIVGSILEGGSDTTALFTRSCILMLVAHPEAQERAHQEIESVVGHDRLPTRDDWDSLPYCQALVKEVLRFRPPVPLGVPRSMRQAETCNGFLIPRGSTVIINQYGILHDPEAYDEPDKFKPERFLSSPVGVKPGVDEAGREDLNFGGGRRVCPGKILAKNSLAINTMNFVWAFKFTNAIDSQSMRPIPVDITNYSKGLTTAPNPFRCQIIPRSPAHITLIEKGMEQAKEIFKDFEVLDKLYEPED